VYGDWAIAQNIVPRGNTETQPRGNIAKL
jgi:hypothetical protein